VSWYTQGGFTDELGKRHESGHHFKLDYWEVLNEVDFEHSMSPQFYTALYGAVVASIRKVEPKMKFVGTALAAPSMSPQFFEYFLNHKNHKPGTPLDMISYHFYATPGPDESVDIWPYSFFDQADGFLNSVRYIQTIRQRLSPETGTTVDEIGAISADDFKEGEPGHITQPIPDSFWNLCAGLYAYLYGELSRLGVEGVGESALAQLPGFFPSVTMMDWNTGEPNARYWVLKLLRDNFGPGDKLVEVSVGAPYVYALGFAGPDGKHKILLVNKRNRPFEVSIPGGAGATEDYIDQTTGNRAPASTQLTGDAVNLGGLAVAVVTLLE
jgi:hypothetical protein